MLIAFRIAVDAFAHMLNYPKTQFLSLLALAVVLADQCDQRLCQSYESDCERSLVDDALNGIVRAKLFRAEPQSVHQERELLLESGLLEVEAIIKLLGRNVQCPIEPAHKCCYTLFLVLDVHTFYGQSHDVYRGEAEVTAANGRAWAELIVEHSRTASHRSHFVDIALRVVCLPIRVLIKCGIQIQEVREEPACSHLAGELVQVVVRVFRKVAYATLLLPYLNREDGRRAITYALVCSVENLPDDATSLGRSIGTIVNGAEYHLVTAT